MTRWYKRHPEQTTNYVLASNTAHVHMPKLKPLAGEHLQNVVASFATGIKQHNTKNQGVLILGTTEAYEKRLFPTVFKENGVPYTNVDRKTEDAIEGVINQTKANRLKKKDQQRLEQIINENIDPANPPRALLTSSASSFLS